MKKMSGPIVFFGNEKLATGLPAAKPVIRQSLENAGYQIEQVITGDLSSLKPHKAELAVLAAYGHIIPQSVLDQFPLGIINIHPSLLPQYRGPTPIEQAILDGVPKTGVSIMQLTKGMDEGPIYKQKTLHLQGNETKAELADKLQALGSELLLEVLPLVMAGELKPRQQPHPDRASYCRLLKKQDGVIDWGKSAVQLEREIRAFAGWPSSFTKLGGVDLTIVQVSVDTESGKPGTANIENQKLKIFTGSGCLMVEELKPAGKKEMSAKEFLAGYKNRF